MSLASCETVPDYIDTACENMPVITVSKKDTEYTKQQVGGYEANRQDKCGKLI